jgi:hypothetical protein
MFHFQGDRYPITSYRDQRLGVKLIAFSSSLANGAKLDRGEFEKESASLNNMFVHYSCLLNQGTITEGSKLLLSKKKLLQITISKELLVQGGQLY